MSLAKLKKSVDKAYELLGDIPAVICLREGSRTPENKGEIPNGLFIDISAIGCGKIAGTVSFVIETANIEQIKEAIQEYEEMEETHEKTH